MPYIYPLFEEEFVVIQPNEKKEIGSKYLLKNEISKDAQVSDFILNNLTKL